MMSPDNITAIPVSNDDQSSGGRQKASLRPPEQALKCPRCDSPNTKFCYYNNYSLTQPRHFCKTCRRYWTNGGALRNVPIGGGCRNDRKTKSGSRLISGDFKNTSASSETSGLKFFNGISPAMDFQLGGLPFSRLLSSTTGICNQFVSSGEISPITTITTSGSLMGFKYPICSDLREGESGGFNGGIQEMGSMNIQSNLASSIESLSSINHDLHWKLQQQRLAMLFGGENQKENGSVSSVTDTLLENHTQKPQPLLFQNLDISNTDVCAVSNPRKSCMSGNTTSDQCFFENSYTPKTTSIINSSSNGNDDPRDWNGVQTWADLEQYGAFPQ